MSGVAQSSSQANAEADLQKRQQQLDDEEEAQKKLAQQNQLSLIRRSFGSSGGALPSQSTSLLG